MTAPASEDAPPPDASPDGERSRPSCRRMVVTALAVAGLAVGAVVVGCLLFIAFVVTHAPFEAPYEPPGTYVPTFRSFEVLAPPLETKDGDLLELELDPRDVEALGVTDPMVAESGDVLEIRPTVGDLSGYCLVGDATVATVDTGSIELTIPAGTCLGPNALMPPTKYDAGFDAHPERWKDDPGPGDEALTGTLVVGVDGCASIDGIRLIWPPDTELGRTGEVELGDDRTFDPGDVVTVPVVRDPTVRLHEGLWCSPTAEVALVADARPVGDRGRRPDPTHAPRSGQVGGDQE